MTTEEKIDLSIIDKKMIKKLQAKQKRLDRVIEVINEHGLDKDKEFMTEINKLIEALIEEKEQ
jgi:hypothetical protein